jgi:citrate lyase subunit beta/citryl-CoA lyase
VLATSALVRRSVLMVPLLDDAAVASSWRHNADAVAMDLSAIPVLDRPAARASLPDAVMRARRGGAEVLVRIDREVAYADIKAVARPGLTGVMLSNAETARDVEEIDAMLAEREREEGIPPGQLEIMLLLDTARGVWNVRQLVRASARIAAVAIDEVRLCRALDIVPSLEFDALSFSRGRVIVETLAAVRLPLGIGHPLGALPEAVDDDAELLPVANRARNTGFKGAVCPSPSWVAACNAAFTPSDEQVAYYRAVREAFAQGVARGTAAVPFPGGRMIDVPVDERAKLVIEWWERCERRDAEKAAALEHAHAGGS